MSFGVYLRWHSRYSNKGYITLAPCVNITIIKVHLVNCFNGEIVTWGKGKAPSMS